MIQTSNILSNVLANINPLTLEKYSYKRVLLRDILADFLRYLYKVSNIYNAKPDMFYATLRMKDSFMLKIPKNQRAAVIEDITQEFIARMNSHLIKHPERRNQQHLKVRPHIVIENRDAYGSEVIEHSHSILMLNPELKKHINRRFDDWKHQTFSEELQCKALEIMMSAKPFQTLTDNHTVNLQNDCHSIKIDPLAESSDVERTLGYDLKTAVLTDDQNAFTILDYNSQERFYEKKNAKRQSAYAQIA